MSAESEARLQLFERLAALPSDRFEALLFALKVPAGLVGGAVAPQRSRVSDLLTWVEGAGGCGLNTLNLELEKVQAGGQAALQKYRLFIRQDSRYQHVRDLYTETEALIPLEAETVEQKSGCSEQDLEPAQKQVERFPVLEGLQKYALGRDRQHVLLAGRPGSGKSTTLQRLLLELAAEGLAGSTVIPVYVQLKSDRAITDLILAEFRRAKVRVTPEQLNDWLLNDQLLLLLDGVNEIPSEVRRHQLQDFREDNPTTPMIFTTRNLSVGGDLGIAKRLEMRPLSEPQMREFVGKYLTKRGMPDQAETLLRQLKDRLREIAETPLLLKMFCDVFDPATAQIPQSKGKLFHLFDSQYDEFKGLAATSDDFRRFKPELLRHLAFGMLQGDPAKPTEAWLTLRRDRAEHMVETLLTGRVEAPGQRAKEWLEDLLEHHLLQVATDPKEIEFHHQLFQEYYAAEALLLRLPELLKDEGGFKRDYLNYLKWTEPIALMLALVDDEAQALRVIKLAMDDVDWMLGGRLSSEAQQRLKPQVIHHINKLAIPDWLRERLLELVQERSLISQPEPQITRRENTYSESQLDKRIAETLSLLLNADSKQAWEATRWLGRIFPSSDEELTQRVGEKIIPYLIKLTDHPDPEMRWCVADSLLLVGNHSATQALLTLLKDSSDDVRKSAALALSRICDKNSIPGLIELLKNPSNTPERTDELCSCISWALCKIGGMQVTMSLLPLLDHSDEAIRWYVIDILGEIKNELSIFGLISALRDSSSNIRSKAAYSLGWSNDKRAVPALINHLWCMPEGNDEFWSVINSLGELGDKRAIPELHKFLSRADDGLKEHIVIALGKIGDKSVIPDLMHILKHSYFSSKEKASEVPSKMNVGIAAPHMVDFLVTDAYLSLDPCMRLVGCFDNFKGNSAAHALPQLLSYINTGAGSAAFRVIEIIQFKCKFYNYEIWQEAVANQNEKLEIKKESQQITAGKVTTILNIETLQANNSAINLGGTIEGDQIGTQKQYAHDLDVKAAISNLQTLLTQLQTQHPNVTTETEALAIIDAEFTEIKQSPNHRLTNLRQQILNPKCHAKAIKDALAEVAKHYLEESVLAKAVITYLDKMSENPNDGA